MQLATSLNVLYDYTDDVARAVTRLAEAGFDALDYNGCDMLSLWPGEVADRHVETLRVTAAQHQLAWVQSHGPMYDYFGKDAERGLADTFRCLDHSGRLGVPWMVMHPTTVPGAGDAAHHQRHLDTNLAYFRQFIDTMERHHVGIAIENMADGFGGLRRYGSVPEELCELVDALAHPLFGICWDTGHAHLQKLPQTEAIGSLGSRLKVLHVQDNNAVHDLHLLPFLGTIDWNTVLAGLRLAGYQGAWTFEVHAAVRFHPDHLRDYALRLAVATGRELIGRCEAPG